MHHGCLRITERLFQISPDAEATLCLGEKISTAAVSEDLTVTHHLFVDHLNLPAVFKGGVHHADSPARNTPGRGAA